MQQIPHDQPYPLTQHLTQPPGYASLPPHLAPQEEREVNLRDYWKVIRKRLWIITAFFFIVVIVTGIATFTMTPIYRGTTTVQINKESNQVVDFKEILAINTMDIDYYQTQYKVLESRSLARRIILSFALSEHPEFLRKPETAFALWKAEALSYVTSFFSTPSKTGPSANEKETVLINQFLKQLKIEPIRNSRLVKIHFNSADPDLAARVSNALAENYIQQNLETRFNATLQAKEWLTLQLEGLKAKVERADEALQAFGAKYGIISLEEKENVTMQRLMELNETLAKVEAERIGKEALYRQARGLQSDDALPLVLDDKVIQDLKQSYIQLESQYMKLSETYKPEYPEMIRLKAQMNTLQRRLESETGKIISGIRNDYEASLRREDLINQSFETQKSRVKEMQENSIRYNILKREADTNRELYKGLLQRMKEAGVSAGITASNIQIIDKAELPTGPYRPDKRLNLLLAAIAGLFLGVGLAFFFEYLDNTIKTPEEVEQMLRLPSFGMVPEISYERKRDKEKGLYYPVELVTFGHPKSMLSEAYRNIRTSVLLSFSEKPPKSIVVTSANPGEGKTTTSINTAIALSQTGANVVVIDGDMRRPRVHELFEDENEVGLSSCLSGNATVESVIRKSAIPNLSFISSGPIPPNPSELLGSNIFKSLLETLGERFDHIIIDCPPVLGFADAAIVSSVIDGVILVALSEKTPRETLRHAKEALFQVNAKILGVVINRVDIGKSHYGYYYYRYNYYYTNNKKRKREIPYASAKKALIAKDLIDS